jgi:hypothetical protein
VKTAWGFVLGVGVGMMVFHLWGPGVVAGLFIGGSMVLILLDEFLKVRAHD